MNSFHFELIHRSKKSRARVGRIHTPHGVIDTPSFVAVGTNGSLKALDNSMVNDIGLQLMFCNTYHMMLQPGSEVVKKAGGLHKFINRKLPIITDSGGFQVFSLAYGSVADELKSRGTKKQGGSVLKINEEGVLFRSYRDGSKVLLTPETSVQAQKDFGADIIIPFDELPPYHIAEAALKKSLTAPTAGKNVPWIRIWPIPRGRQCMPSFMAASIRRCGRLAVNISQDSLSMVLPLEEV